MGKEKRLRCPAESEKSVAYTNLTRRTNSEGMIQGGGVHLEKRVSEER